MAEYAHALEADSDLRYRHPILLNMSHDMGKLRVMYDDLWDALHGQETANIPKAMFFFKAFAILSFSINRLRFALTLPNATELILLVKYLSFSMNIRAMYRNYQRYTYKEAVKLERAPNVRPPRVILNLYAELLGKLARERHQAKEYIRANIINEEGELTIVQVLSKMFVWHDTLVEQSFRYGDNRRNRDGAGHR